ncbi:MAG: serine protein kinase [Candidatus Muproteobacteria bacterium RBG_16_65_34]|uniref:Serine protein kinase n=1 Tax=Candidatus Muproteobacteria bacterium RBG_16_65_34 TaxID=1817760 RepID=A0A1F6TQM0_9PROT|nr:MAG: serine protein kinase [Candidatus Muproteobacteria bacterium RBG_16_65_34]
MLQDPSTFTQLIERDRARQENLEWRGTLLEYLERVKADPAIAKLAHARLYDVVIRPGVRELTDAEEPRLKRLFGDEPVKIYPFFSKEFFGIERTLAQVVRYFHSASLHGEESRQVLYLMGPVGAGKSSLIERIQRGLEQNPPVYTIEGCPMAEEPLHLIPKHLRPEFEKTLNAHIEGDLCPVCRYRLKEEFQGRYESVPIATAGFSRHDRRGIGVVPPVDPNNQDTSVLIGSVDISKLDTYSEGDPRALDLNGAFNVGNRGMTEFIEVFKNEAEYLHTMITATQEKFIPAPGRHGTVYVDTCIVAHSNEAEWQRFKSDSTNEAILDRIVVVKVPYNLRLSEEIKIYQKLLDQSEFRAHIAPHTLELAAMFAILSRLEPTNKCDLMTKLRLYSGEEVVEKGKTVRINVRELQEDVRREGMFGISPRFIMKAIDNALADSAAGITPINVRESLINMVKAADLPDDTRKQYLEFLQDTLHKAYLEILEKEITRAFVYSFEEHAETLFQNYLDHTEAYVNKSRVKDRNTGEELQPDEGFLKSVEEQIAVIGSSVQGFRQDVMSYLWAKSRRGERVSYKSYEPLKEAIERKLMSSVREMSRVITKARTRDEEQIKKYGDLVKGLLERGYSEYSAEVVLKYAANNLWKD